MTTSTSRASRAPATSASCPGRCTARRNLSTSAWMNSHCVSMPLRAALRRARSSARPDESTPTHRRAPALAADNEKPPE